MEYKPIQYVQVDGIHADHTHEAEAEIARRQRYKRRIKVDYKPRANA
ncbi:MAG: hypothetical protein V6Z82_00890 [Flavobacteriales bacterium]